MSKACVSITRMTLRHWVRALEERVRMRRLVGEHHFRIWRLYMVASQAFATPYNSSQTLLANPMRMANLIPAHQGRLYSQA